MVTSFSESEQLKIPHIQIVQPLVNVSKPQQPTNCRLSYYRHRIARAPPGLKTMTEDTWPVRKVQLSPPSLEELAATIHGGLKTNFTTASASVSTPPDLRQPPFHLAARGLSGHARIADVGGPANIRPSPDLLAMSRLIEMPRDGGLLIGAGVGPFFDLGRNSELLPNIAYGAAAGGGRVSNCTRYAKTLEDGGVLCEEIGDRSTGFGLMCNLFASDGEAGPLLHVTARGRTGTLNFPQAIQKAVGDVYGEKLISMGGVFVIRSGKVKMHVMPDFPGKPFDMPDGVAKWLRVFDMDAPMVCVSVLHAGNDGDLDLWMEHTHGFAANGPEEARKGGHYRYDLDETMDTVEYEGWFNVAETLYRVDPINN